MGGQPSKQASGIGFDFRDDEPDYRSEADVHAFITKHTKYHDQIAALTDAQLAELLKTCAADHVSFESAWSDVRSARSSSREHEHGMFVRSK